MAQRRKQRIRERGKLSLSRYFQELAKGQKVAIKPEASLPFSLPIGFSGKMCVVESKRGKAYVVKIKDGNMTKRVILLPIHLVKLV